MASRIANPGPMTTSSSDIPSPFWEKQLHADRRPLLLARGRMMAAWRRQFETREFLEVETAVLQVSPGNEAHIAAFATDLTTPDGLQQRLYLHSSPEFACKKLLAAGEPRIFTFAKVFRNGERGPLHHPEFTMLEWYRAGEQTGALIEDCCFVLAAAAEAAGTRQLNYRGRQADAFAEPQLLTVADAFTQFAGIDVLSTLNGDAPDRDAFAEQAEKAGVAVAHDDVWSDIFSKVLVARVEPHLGCGRPTVLMDYPACEAALARQSSRDPRVADRFELYACGVELANAFGELTDAREQRRRFVAEMDERERVYGERYPIDEDFLQALAHMPEASGIAMGVDRLVMLATGAPRIDQVMWTPVATPGAS